MCSGSEAGSYLRLIDFVYHSTLGLRVIKKKKKLSEHVHAWCKPVKFAAKNSLFSPKCCEQKVFRVLHDVAH